MKAKRIFLKAMAMVMVVLLTFPSQVFAMQVNSKKSKSYDGTKSIMGLVSNNVVNDVRKPDIDQEIKDTLTSDIIKEENDDYTIEKSASISMDKAEITYRISLAKKAMDDDLAEAKAIFASLKEGYQSDLRVDKIESIDKDGKEAEIAFKETRPTILNEDKTIETLAVSSDYASNTRVYYLKAKLSDEAMTYIKEDKDGKNLDNHVFALDFALIDKENTYQDRLSFTKNTDLDQSSIEDEGHQLDKSFDLLAVDKQSLIQASYQHENNFIIGKTPASLSWTDLVAGIDDKSMTYEINLDDSQDTINTQIQFDIYEPSSDGFVINKEYSKTLEFAKSLDLDIKPGNLAKISFVTNVKENTNPKEFTFNNKTIANPTYRKDTSKNTNKEDSSSEDEDPEGADANKEKEQTPKLDKAEQASDLAEQEPSPKKEEPITTDDSTRSAIDLNREAILNKFDSSNRLDLEKENAIIDLTSQLQAYNNEEIAYENLVKGLDGLKSKLSRAEFAEVLATLTAGLNEETYKVANLDVSDLTSLVYGANTATNEQTESEQKTDSADETTSTADLDQTTDQSSQDNETIKEKAVEEFDQALDQAKEESKNSKDADKGLLENLAEGVKGIFGQTDLAKADKELKAALADEANTLADIQALLHELAIKYELTREDETKLMAGNEAAIKDLIARDADENFNPWLLYDLSDSNKAELEKKKYNVITRFDTSTVAGPIQAGQFFKVHLDNQLTVKDPSSLKPIEYNGNVIAKPSYDANTNTITYKITKDITENIQVPLDIPVDYNTANIDLDEDGNFTVTNRISGLGVTDPKALPAQKVSKNGDKLGLDPSSMSDADLHDTTFFFDPDSTYKVNFDAKSYPVIEDRKMTAIDWEITFDANGQDLKDDLGLLTNFTAVEGSGIGEIKDIKLNGQDIEAVANNMGDSFLINDSKNVAPTNGSKYVYTFTTGVEEKRESYVLDVSGILNKKDKTGAVRLVQEGYEKDKVEADTPTRIITTNRVTNKGKFLPNNQIRWVVTEEVSSGDPGSLPLVTRTLSDNQTLDTLKVSYYAPNDQTGKMEKVGETKDLTKSYPVKEGSLGETPHKAGTIAVYEYITNIKEKDKKGYSLGDNNISEYEDVDVNIKWSTIKGEYPPEETITLTPKSENGEEATLEVPARKAGDPYEFNVKVLNVKKWEVGSDGKATPIEYTLSQKLPDDKGSGLGKKISYREVNVFYDPHQRRFEVRNQILEVDNKIPANITITKTGDEGQPLAGARFQLVGNDQTYEAITGDDGKLEFKNINPGKYILSESEAPLGYIRDNGQDTITVNDDGTVSWNTTNLVENVSSGSSTGVDDLGGLSGEADRYTTKVEKREHPKGQPEEADFMNTISYTEYEDGAVTAYIMLKPFRKDANSDGTDEDTRLAIMPSNIEIDGIEMYNANHSNETTENRELFLGAMENQDMLSWQIYLDTLDGLKIPLPYEGGTENRSVDSNKIKSYLNVRDNHLETNVAAVDIPKQRFGADWAFIVKVDGRVINKNQESDVAFSWYSKTGAETREIKDISNPIPSMADRAKEREEGAKVENAELKVSNKKAKQYPVKVTKKDKNGNPLANAEFTMTDSFGNVIKRGKTDANGYIEFKDLPEGIYELRETNPPEGYKNDEIRIEVTVTASGQILYQGFDKNGNEIPAGDKYLVGKNQGPSVNGPPTESKIEVLKKTMTLDENAGYGTKPGVWEEASYESYQFDLELNIRNKRGGDTFTINFDKNWNLSQWSNEMPVIKDDNNAVIARPSMNYETNVLTYTLTSAVNERDNVRAKVHIDGIRPSKYYVKNDGIYYFTDTINTGNTVETLQTRVDAYLWVFYGTAGQMRYITQNVDTYNANAGTEEKPKYVMRDVTIYNPDGLKPSGDRTMRIFYGASDQANPSVFNNKIDPPQSPTKVVVWRVENPNPDTMPLSGGVKPKKGSGPYEYVTEFDVTGKDRLTKSDKGVFFSYDENRAGPNKSPDLGKMENVQFKITLPNDSAGYVIENFYEVKDEKSFRENYTQTIALYKTSWGNTAGMAQFKPNPNKASGSSGTSVDVVEPNYDLTVFNKKSDKGKFTITKYGKENNDEKILPEAYFRLTDSNGKVVKEDYTSPAGLVTFDELDSGTYTLTETRAPEGFKPIDKKINVIVSNEGQVTFEGDGIGNGGPYKVTTPASPEVKVEEFEQPDIFNTNPYPAFMNMSAKLKSENGDSIMTRIFLNPKQDATNGQGPNRPTSLVIKHNWAKDVNVDVYKYPENKKGSMDTVHLNPTYIDENIKVIKSNYETTIKFPTDETDRWGGDGYVVVAKADFNEGELNKYISYQWRSDTDITVLPKEPNNLGIKRTAPDFPPGALKAVNEKSDTEIIIKKVDEDDENTVLAGAEFTLLNSDLNEVLAQRTTGADGLAKFEDLTPGTYYIKETEVPDGYKDPNKRWKVVVDENKDVTITPQTIKSDESVTETPTPGEDTSGETPGDNTNPGTTDPELTPPDDTANPTPEEPITPPDNGLTYSIRNYDKIPVMYDGNFAGRMGSTITETDTKGVFNLSLDFDRAYALENQPTELRIQFNTDRFDIRPAEGSLDGSIYTVSNFDPHWSNGNASIKFTVVPKNISAGYSGSPIKYTQFAGEVVYPTHATISASKQTAFNVINLFKPMTVYAAEEAGWVPVDLNKSSGRETKDTAEIKTQVTEINKAENKYKQVFIVNKNSQSIGGPTLDIYSWPNTNDIWITGRNPNLKILRAQAVDPSSTPTNLVNPGRTYTTSVANSEVNGYNRSKVTISTPGTFFSGTIAVEVEYDYPESGQIGLGATYVKRNKADPQTVAQKFYSEDEVNREPKVTYKEIEEESIIPIPEDPIRRENPEMLEGTENEVSAGKTGRKIDVYKQKYVDGRPEGDREKISTEIIAQAQPRIIEYGTKPKVVTREESKNVDQEIKFETTTVVDVNKKKGEKTTVTEGKNGSVTYKYTITYDTSDGLNATRPADWPADAPTASPKANERVVSYTKEEVPNTKEEPTTEVISIGLGIDPNAKVENGTEETLSPDGKTKQIIYTITNKKEDTEIYFRKVEEGDETKVLPDAKFELLKENEKKEFTNVVDKKGNKIEVTSGENGIFKFGNLEDGTYQVKETEAPKGYIKLKNPVFTFKVEDNKIYTNENTEIKDNSEDKPIDIENKKATYPSTGGAGVFKGFALIGTAVMLTALAYFGIYQREKNRKHS